MEYRIVTLKVSFGNAGHAAFMSRRKYDVKARNGDCSSISEVRIFVSRIEVRYQYATSLQNSIRKRSTFR
jgi:hypothetical protein